ncbi:LPS export ABC transporter permease LptG [Cognatishimia sp. MH4019]|uniref:LPS export ABC transporter permease LptG n=1 Tax=Cognatishimia sp. MH4019 TaxID=2854030 RepID=UPI001CD42774|nr:LPS export ABC transporter permease LptG [Cognatishimia sp. MH4019]
MILHGYFARRFLRSFFSVLAVFSVMLLLLDLIEQVRRFDADEATFSQVVELSLLNLPQGVYRILPLITILATIALFLNLARTSELVVTRASGRSALRSLIAPLAMTFLLGMLALAALNPIVAATITQYEAKSERYSHGSESVLSLSEDGLWLRQGNAEGQTVIHALRANETATQLRGVSFFTFAPDGTPTQRLEANSATLTDGEWRLGGVKKWELSDPNPERTAETHLTYALPTDLTVEQIRDGFAAPISIPIWELSAFIEDLDTAGFSSRAHRVWLQTELAMPLLMVAMVLLGAGFTMRHTRLGKTGIMVLAAVLVGFGFYFVRNFAQVLGESGQLPVSLAAWAPPFAAVCLALGLLLHLEDG